MTTFALVCVGAGPGLGLAAARRFGAAGHHVALLSRNTGHLGVLAAELEGDGIRARGYAADVLAPASLTTALNKAAEELGLIEVPWGNLALFYKDGPAIVAQRTAPARMRDGERARVSSSR